MRERQRAGSYRGTGRFEGRKAIAFAREGADVVLSYLPEKEEDASRIAKLIEKAGRKAVKPVADARGLCHRQGGHQQFHQGLAQQLAPKGIRVNAVAPGPIWTPLQVSSGQPKEALTEFGKDTPPGH